MQVCTKASGIPAALDVNDGLYFMAFKNLEVRECFDRTTWKLLCPELGWQRDAQDPAQTLDVEGASSCSAPPTLLHSLPRAAWSHPITDTCGCVKSVSAQMYP